MDHVVQIITVCSAVIRIAISFHTVLGCAMLASISLTRRRVLFKDVAAMSMARCAILGPLDIFLPVLRGTMWEVNRCNQSYNQLWDAVRRMVWLLVVGLLIFLGVASQFTSTILLFDVARTTVPDVPQSMNARFLFMPGLFTNYRPEYPVFAEKLATFHSFKRPESAGSLSDTGPTLRALFPLSREKRRSIISYKGPAYLFDAHVLCFSPTIESISSSDALEPVAKQTSTHSTDHVRLTVGLGLRLLDKYLASGTSNYTFPEAELGNRTVGFNCTIPIYEQKNPRNYILCGGDGPAGVYQSNDSHIGLPLTEIGDERISWLLAIDAGETSADQWHKARFPGGPIYGYESDEWTKATDTTDSVTIKLSLRLHSLRASGDVAITAVGKGNYVEPVPSMNGSGGQATIDTLSIRKQLGVSAGSSIQRNIMTITRQDNDLSIERSSRIDAVQDFINVGTSVSLCAGCLFNSATGFTTVHPIWSSIFMDTLRDTHTLTLAIQATMTVVISANYYDRLSFAAEYSTDRLNATVQQIRRVSAPLRITGFVIVIATITLHLILTLSIALVFLKDPRNTVGQCWQTIAQLQQGEARAFLDLASMWGDDRVQSWMECDGRSWANKIVDIQVDEYDTMEPGVVISFVDSNPGRILKLAASIKESFRSCKRRFQIA